MDFTSNAHGHAPDGSSGGQGQTGLDEALSSASVTDSYTHTFRKPFSYQGKTYETLRFQWDRLTGQDSLSIENELQSLGKSVVIPAFSGEYLIRMAARACAVNLGSDAFALMPLFDHNKIRSAARSFLLASE